MCLNLYFPETVSVEISQRGPTTHWMKEFNNQIDLGNWLTQNAINTQ